MTPSNDLERLLAARNFGAQSYPQLFRLLRESPLVFLLPYHPELLGSTVNVANGDALPKFVVWQSDSKVRQIPIFTSANCANEACTKIGAPDHQFVFAEMQGKQLFELLACQLDPIVINPACSTHSTFFDLNAVKKLADGSILIPEHGNRKAGTAQIVDPADYPTDFLQPLFVFLRAHREVKAAWLFRELAEPGAPTCYVFVLKTMGDATAMQRDFRVVASCACPKGVEYGVTLLDPLNADLVKVTSGFIPFYAAADYLAPSPLREDGPGKA